MPDAIGLLDANHGQDLTLLAGQLYVGTTARSVRTLLGSCVAVALWCPRYRVGGLCHYLLPSRKHQQGDPLDGRFAEEALHLMVYLMHCYGARPSECEAHLHGGADTMPEVGGARFNVGERNIEHGWKLIEHHGFQLVNVDVGDHVPRHVSMDLQSGEVSVRRGTRPVGVPA